MLQLGWMNQNEEAGKKADFYIFDSCVNYIRELDVYSWMEDKDETPEDGNDHMVNSVQYAFIPYRNKIGSNKEKK